MSSQVVAYAKAPNLKISWQSDQNPFQILFQCVPELILHLCVLAFFHKSRSMVKYHGIMIKEEKSNVHVVFLLISYSFLQFIHLTTKWNYTSIFPCNIVASQELVEVVVLVNLNLPFKIC